jgi:hypothetical protein
VGSRESGGCRFGEWEFGEVFERSFDVEILDSFHEI